MTARVERLLYALAFACALFVFDQIAADAQTFGGGIVRVLINGTRQPSGVSEIQCKHSGAACYRDGGLVTFDLDQVSGGGGSLGDGSVGAGNLSGALLGSLVFYTDAGALPGIGTSLGQVCYMDGGTLDGAPCAQQQSTLFVAPSQFVLRNEDGGVGLRANTPTAGDRPIGVTEFRSLAQDWDYCFSADVTTTNATATVFHRIAFPAATTLLVSYACTATSPDGGATVSAVYQRRLLSTLVDGGSTPATVGGIDTIGTDRENDTTWGGPAVVTYDGGMSTGVAELVTQGAASQTITWNCSGCWKRTPRADAGF